MEQSSNNVLENLFQGIKPNIEFNQFLNNIYEQSNYNINWKYLEIDDNKLYLINHEWLCKLHFDNNNQDDITKYFNNTIIDSNYNIIMYGGPKVYDSNRDNINLENILKFINEDAIIYEAYEGTTINIFNYNNKWFYSTRRKFDMYESIYGSKISHGLMFDDIIENKNDFESKLNKDYTYQFILVHNNNRHISKIDTNKLILISIRDRLNNHKIINETLEFKSVVLPKNCNIEELKNNNDLTQGIIINFNDYIFRIYNDNYSKILIRKPYYANKQEELFHTFQNNRLKETSDEKTNTFAAYNYVAIMIFRIMNHFTVFNNKNNNLKFTQINQQDYEKIKYHSSIVRNLYKLQRLPFMLKINKVDFDQIKHHLKFYTNYRDLNKMFKCFYKNEELNKLVKFSFPSDGQIKNNIEKFYEY